MRTEGHWLENGQRVHVCAQRHNPTFRVETMHVRDDAGSCDMGLVFDAPSRELLRHKGHRLVFLEGQLWMGMKVAAKLHPLAKMRFRKALDAFLQGHGNRVGLSWDQAV